MAKAKGLHYLLSSERSRPAGPEVCFRYKQSNLLPCLLDEASVQPVQAHSSIELARLFKA